MADFGDRALPGRPGMPWVLPYSTMVGKRGGGGWGAVMTSYWSTQKSDSGHDQEVGDRKVLQNV